MTLTSIITNIKSFPVRSIALLSLIQVTLSLAAPQITVVYPREGDTIQIGSGDSTFIFGHVEPGLAQLQINDSAVPLYHDGTFLAFLPVRFGAFTWKCRASLGPDTTVMERHIFIRDDFAVFPPDSFYIDTTLTVPDNDRELISGDLLRVSFRGTPGGRASFSIPGLCHHQPMVESSPDKAYYWGESAFTRSRPVRHRILPGFFSGCLVVPPDFSGENLAVHFTLFDAQGDSITAAASGMISVKKPLSPDVVECISELTVLRTAPNGGYYYFLPQGVRLWITGKTGAFLRVRLAQDEEAWVLADQVRKLPAGTPPPHGVVQVIRTKAMGRSVRVQVLTGVRVPYRVVQDIAGSSIEIFFYGLSSDTDWMRFDMRDPMIRNIRWQEPQPDVYHVIIELNQSRQWGYHAFYDPQNHFNIDIKKAPRIHSWPASPLKGLSVVVDPGHGPDTGAVGPSGYMEKTANLALAYVLQEKLRRKGAFVYLTREQEEGITLAARSELSAFLNGDILLSLHHNALPDGINPFVNHGTSTYYFHPASSDLARIIQERLCHKLKLLDFGVYFDNLAMCRVSEMLAVLVEPAFMMYPEEEMLIKTEAFRNKCTDAIVEALEKYLRKCKE
jgi:N-acetylmuramoyl-L-alanine amidase